MKERIITALVMIAVLVGVIFFIPFLFVPLVAAILGIAIWEWCRTCQLREINWYADAIATICLFIIGCIFPLVLMILQVLTVLHYFYATYLIIQYEKHENFRIHRSYLRWIGPVILSALATSLVYIYHPAGEILHTDEAKSLLYIIMIIAAADSGAYFVGRTLGKHKLSPKVSPKKTIEGLIGGLISVCLVAACCQFMVADWHLSFTKLLIISLAAALISVIGDLFISVIKRQNNIKDTSQILPGHGGILDRVDGLIAGIPTFHLLQQII